MQPPNQDRLPLSATKVTLSDVLDFLKRGAPVALAVMIAGAVVAFLITQQMAPVYRATASIVGSPPPTSFGTLQLVAAPQIDPRVYQSAILDGTIISDAIQEIEGVTLGQVELEAFKSKVGLTLEAQEASSVLHIHFRDEDPARAALYANTIAERLVLWDRNRSVQFIENSILALERSIAEIDSQLRQSALEEDQASQQSYQAALANLRLQRIRDLDAARAGRASAVVVGALNILSPASVPETPVGPRVVFNTFIALVLGLVLGYGVQLIRWGLRDEVSTKQKLEEATRLPVLAAFPKSMTTKVRHAGEAASFLAAHVLRESINRTPLVVGITSSSNYQEKAGIAIALAERLAASDARVLLLDFDMRHRGPGLGISSKSAHVPGTEAYLRDHSISFQPVTAVMNEYASFDVVPSNVASPQSSELIKSGIEEVLGTVKGLYDMVVLDLPPMIYADALSAAPACQMMLLCVEASTPRSIATEAANALRYGGTPVVGAVLTGATLPSAPTPAFPRKSRATPGQVLRVPTRGAQATAKAGPQAKVRVRQR